MFRISCQSIRKFYAIIPPTYKTTLLHYNKKLIQFHSSAAAHYYTLLLYKLATLPYWCSECAAYSVHYKWWLLLWSPLPPSSAHYKSWYLLMMWNDLMCTWQLTRSQLSLANSQSQQLQRHFTKFTILHNNDTQLALTVNYQWAGTAADLYQPCDWRQRWALISCHNVTYWGGSPVFGGKLFHAQADCGYTSGWCRNHPTVSEMTENVSSRTLNLAQSINQSTQAAATGKWISSHNL